VLNHCHSWDKFANTYLSHSRQWFNKHLTLYMQTNALQHRLFKYYTPLTFNFSCNVVVVVVVVSFRKMPKALLNANNRNFIYFI